MGAATFDAIVSSSATLLDDEAYPELDGDAPPFSKIAAVRGAGRSFGNIKFVPTDTHFDNSTPFGGAMIYLFCCCYCFGWIIIGEFDQIKISFLSISLELL